MHKSWDSWNRSLNQEHNLLHRYSSSRKRHSSCFVGAIQCGRDWSESASGFWGGPMVKLWLVKQQGDQCDVHQGWERKPWWSVPLFIQYRDSPHLSYVPGGVFSTALVEQLSVACNWGQGLDLFSKLIWHASTQWASRSMINSRIFPLASYILPCWTEQLSGLKSSVCLKEIAASGQCLW